jgi:hypothetical protein
VGRQALSQQVLVAGRGDARLQADPAFGDEPDEALFHGLHAQLHAGLDGGVDHVVLALADEVRDAGRGDHDLHGRHPARTGGVGQQALGDHPLEGRGQLLADLGLLPGRKGAHQAVDGRDAVAGVEGGEDKVSGLGGHDGRAHGLQVAHFAHQQDVRVGAQGVAQGVGEGRHVGVQFALVDDAQVVLIDILDGVLDGDDVAP